jgi:hypothetical protein
MSKTKTHIPLIAHDFYGGFTLDTMGETLLTTPDEVQGFVDMFFEDNYRRPGIDLIEVRVREASIQLMCKDRDTALSFTRPSDPTLRTALNMALAAYVGNAHPVVELDEVVVILNPTHRLKEASQAA